MAENGAETYDISSLLSSKNRDYLVRNNGDQVKIEDLKDKTLGLYFSASWCPPCRRFTPKLIEGYNSLSSKSKPFEVIFISADNDEESFTGEMLPSNLRLILSEMLPVNAKCNWLLF